MTVPQRLYFVQLSTDLSRSEGPMEPDLFEHLQFVFAVEGENFEAMLDSLRQIVTAECNDESSALYGVSFLDLDWAVKAEAARPGLLWGNCILTEVVSESSCSFQNIVEWKAPDGSYRFIDFADALVRERTE